jgi:hypothetical protein
MPPQKAWPAMSKYRSTRTNGYASKREANLAAQLQALQRGAQIRELSEQVPFLLVPSQKGKLRNERPLKYIADFVWKDKEGRTHVGDAKGLRTPLYVVKRKLMRFLLNIEVEEL